MGGANLLANSYIATGQAKAWQTGMSPERFAERAAAYTDIERRNQELKTLRATRPTEADLKTMAETQSIELQNALEMQKEMLRANNKKTSFSGFERFDADGDVRHINTMFADLAASGSKMYGNIARVDRFTEKDRDWLINEGFPPKLVDAMINDENMNRSYVKQTMKDGTIRFGDLDALKGVTGYNDYASTKEIERQTRARTFEQLAILGYEASDEAAEAIRRVRAEMPDADPRSPQFQERLTEVMREMQRESKSWRPENLTEKEAEARRRTLGELGPEAEGTPEWDAAFSRHMSAINTEYNRPSKVRSNEQADEARTALEDLGFWDMDFTNLSMRDRAQVEPYIRKIEEFSGASLSENDKKTLMRIKELTQLAEGASDLQQEDVGPIDNVLRQFKRYIFNNTDGTTARSSYNAFRNTMLHAFYGSALSQHEMANFVKQFGSAAQQLGPVLGQFNTSLRQLRASYEAIMLTNDPYVIQYRTGKTEFELEDVINAIDERIEMIDAIAAGRPVNIAPPKPTTVSDVKLTPEQIRDLDSIYEGNNTPEPPQ